MVADISKDSWLGNKEPSDIFKIATTRAAINVMVAKFLNFFLLIIN